MLSIPAVDGMPAATVRKLVLQGGRQHGMEVIEVDNGRLRYWLLPHRGMGIWKLWLDDLEIGWHSPVAGPVLPAFVPIYEPSGLGWLDGFDELLCRCGLESNGAPEFDAAGRLRYPLHGRIANLPADHVGARFDDASKTLRVEGQVDEARFHFHKFRLHSATIAGLGQSSLEIVDSVVNMGAVSRDFQLLYHINFGSTLLDAGSVVVAPIKKLVPRTAEAAAAVATWSLIEAPRAGFAEQVFFMELLGDASGMTRTLLRNASGTCGVSLHFSILDLPCFTLWKNTGAMEDGYVVGLEPGTNFPNPRSYEAERGRIGRLAPGARRDFRIGIAILRGRQAVAEEEATIAELQRRTTPTIYGHPQREWSIEAHHPRA
jgi:hypothetical protein